MLHFWKFALFLDFWKCPIFYFYFLFFTFWTAVKFCLDMDFGIWGSKMGVELDLGV
jgi:hypothetical protein